MALIGHQDVANPQGAQRARGPRAIGQPLLDVITLGLAILASRIGAEWAGATRQPLAWAVLYAALVLAVTLARGGYRFRLEVSPFEYLGAVLAATATAAMAVIAIRILAAPDPDAASQTVRLWSFSMVYLGLGRVATAIAYRHADRLGRATLIVGAGDLGRTVARRLLERPQIGLRPVGFLDKEPREADADGGLPVLGASWDLEAVVERHNIEHVVIAFSTAPSSVLVGLIRRARALGTEVSVVPRLYEEVTRYATVEHLGGIALLRIHSPNPKGWEFQFKYALDRVAGLVLVVVLSPLMVAIAIAVKLTSSGPVLFRQPRVGLDGREFELLKFRTMHAVSGAPEADAAWAQSILGSIDAPEVRELADDRRTPLGRFLRRFCLDELPQFIHVLRGEMSLVGPRPERTAYVRAFEVRLPRYGDRHRVKSGVTGWAQVNGLRGETSLLERVEWDNYYVENWTPMLDVKILLLTIPALLGGRQD